MNPQIPTIKSEIVTNFVDKLGTPGSIPTEVVIETLNDIVDAIPDVDELVPVNGDKTINDRKTFTESLTIPDGIELQDSASIANIIQLPKDIRFQKLQRTIPDILVTTSAPNKCKDFLRLVPANNYCAVRIYAVNQDSTVKTFEFLAGYDALNENAWSTLVPLDVYNDRGQDFNIEIKKVAGFGPTNFGIIFRYRNTTGTNQPSQASLKVEFGLRLPAVGVNYDQFNILTTPEYDFSGGTSLYGQKLTRTPDGLNWVDVANKKFLKEGDVVPVDISGKTDKTYVDTQDGILDAKFANYLPTTQKGAASGLTPLGPDSKVPAQYLPAGAQVYKGTWNPVTNTPALADGVGTAGWTYRVTVAGDRNLGSGVISFLAGDDAIYNGTIWERNPDSLSVASVAGKTGDVTLVKSDVGLSNVDNTSDANKPVSTAQATAIGQREPAIANGTNAQFLRGDKTWQSFATTALAVALTGLGGVNTPITAAMTLLTALGNLQAQITAIITLLASKANLVGGKVPVGELPDFDLMTSVDNTQFDEITQGGVQKVSIKPALLGGGGTSFSQKEYFRTKNLQVWDWMNDTSVRPVIGGTNVITGTPAAQSYGTSTGTWLNKQARYGLDSGATAGSLSSVRQGYYQANLGTGFDFTYRFMIGDAAAVADARTFVGLQGSVVDLPIAAAEPSAAFNIIGFGNDSTDTNLQLMYNDGAGAATKINLGANYPTNTRSADVYEVNIKSIAGAISWSIIRYAASTGAIVNQTSGTIAAGTAKLPAIDQRLMTNAIRSNSASALAVRLVHFIMILEWQSL